MATYKNPTTGNTFEAPTGSETAKNFLAQGYTTDAPSTPSTAPSTPSTAPSVITSTAANQNLNEINQNLAGWNTSIMNNNARNAAINNTPPPAPVVAPPTDAGREKTNTLLEDLKSKLNQPNTYNYQAGTPTERPKSTVDTELMAAYDRLNAGTATPKDQENLAYAQKNGWTPQTTPAEQPPIEQPPIEPAGATGKTEKTTGQTEQKDLTSITDTTGKSLYNADGTPTLAGLNDELEKSHQEYIDKMNQITNGTFPLAPEEQAQVDAMRKKFDDMIAEQRTANANYQGATTKLGITTGRARYAGEEQIGIAKTAVDQGIKKVSDLEANALASIASLKQAIKDKNYKQVQDLYDNTGKYLDAKRQIIKDTQDQVTTALTQQKMIMEISAKQEPKTQVLGDVLYQYNDQTGGWDKVAGEGTAQKPITLSAGESLYDPTTGKVLFTAPEKAEPNKVYDITDANGNKISATYDPTTGKYNAINVGGMPAVQTGGNVPGTIGFPQIDVNKEGYTTVAVSGAGGLTQAAIDKAAIQYATTGVMPAVGLGSSGAAAQKRDAIQARAAELDANGTISANKSKLQALTTSLSEQTKYLNTMERSINTVDENLQILAGLAQKVNKSNKPIVNEVVNGANAKYFGSGDLAAYKSALQTVRTEYSAILARGQQVTEGVRQEAANLIPDNISADQLSKVLAVLHNEGQNVKSNAQKQVDDISNQLNNIIGGGNLYKQTTQATQAPTSLLDYMKLNNDNYNKVNILRASFPNATPDEIWNQIKQEEGYSGGAGQPEILDKLENKPIGYAGGQCGHFVNQNTGLGLGDSYQSKMNKMTIKNPSPQDFKVGMVFTMPYKDTGHTGFIVGVNNDGTVMVKDSNYHLNEKVDVHKIAMNKITGLRPV